VAWYEEEARQDEILDRVPSGIDAARDLADLAHIREIRNQMARAKP
jgi:hypothetical protein